MPDNSNRHLVAELTSPNGLKNGVFGEDNSLDVIIYENSNITLSTAELYSKNRELSTTSGIDKP